MFQRTSSQMQIKTTWNGQAIPRPEWVQVELEIREKGLLVDISAPYYGDPAPAGHPGPWDGLWDYEVVEVFISHGETYTELELGPQGHYLLLCLQGVRQVTQKLLPLKYEYFQTGGQWLGMTLIPWEYLPPQPWTFNAYAIHGRGAARRYLAAFPKQGQAPDFHQLDSFQALSFAPKVITS